MNKPIFTKIQYIQNNLYSHIKVPHPIEIKLFIPIITEVRYTIYWQNEEFTEIVPTKKYGISVNDILFISYPDYIVDANQAINRKNNQSFFDYLKSNESKDYKLLLTLPRNYNYNFERQDLNIKRKYKEKVNIIELIEVKSDFFI